MYFRPKIDRRNKCSLNLFAKKQHTYDMYTLAANLKIIYSSTLRDRDNLDGILNRCIFGVSAAFPLQRALSCSANCLVNTSPRDDDAHSTGGCPNIDERDNVLAATHRASLVILHFQSSDDNNNNNQREWRSLSTQEPNY